MKLTNSEKQTVEEQSKYIIEEFAERLDKDHLKNPFAAISSLKDYLIIRIPSDDDRISERKTFSGFSIFLDSYNCIYINSNHTLGRQHFTCWHEFYHRIADNSDENFEFCELDEKEEKKADYFASCMIIPKDSLKDFLFSKGLKYNNLTIENFIQIQHHFQCSLAVAITRVEDIYDIKYNKFKSYSQLSKAEELQDLTISLNLPLDLIQPTIDFVLPRIFLESIKINLKNSLISKETAYQFSIFFEENEVKFLW